MIRDKIETERYTLYLSDCLDVLPTLQAGSVDAVVTDPPYGIGLGVQNNQCKDKTHLGKKAYATYEDTYENFIDLIVPRLNSCLDFSSCAAVFSGPHIHEQRKPIGIGGIYHPAATGRTPWGSKNFLPVLFYGNPPGAGQHRPTVVRSTDTAELSEHPCPKPLPWMNWLVNLASEDEELILDPFMGSGTTGVACMKLGRKFIGCEIDEAYFKIAHKRIAAAAEEPPLFKAAREAEQAELVFGEPSI